MTDTATVETLTAEVRVLMVGNRQITLSIARQLDVVKLPDVDPFGRVHLSKDFFHDPMAGGTVIGRHNATGALVRADYQPRQGRPLVDGADFDDEEKFVIVCDQNVDSFGWHDLRFQDRPIRVNEEVTQKCGQHGRSYSGEPNCGHWNPNGHDALIQTAIDKHDRLVKLHRDAAELPLIVLAGLR